MPAVDLTDNEWQMVIAIVATAPWRDANPLIMKIGQQLHAQQEAAKQPPKDVAPPPGGNGKEASHAQ